jgi:hypothetical protein
MEAARKIWDELGLPKLTPRPPWHGYSLGLWSEELVEQAKNAVAGEHERNAEYSRARGIDVPKGADFVEQKKKYLAQELDEFLKRPGKSGKR